MSSTVLEKVVTQNVVSFSNTKVIVLKQFQTGGDIFALVPLELNLVFHTLDHNGKAGNFSEAKQVLYSVPQGSDLGPLQFFIYIQPFNIIHNHDIGFHFNADDSEVSLCVSLFLEIFASI